MAETNLPNVKSFKIDQQRFRRNLRRRERYHGIYNLSSWHAARLRILGKEDDYAPFIQFIKWKGGIPPNENAYDNELEGENDYLSDLTLEFRSLGGYEFFREHHLDLPPIGIGW